MMRLLMILSVLLTGNAAAACTLEMPADWVDSPIQVLEDGSFDSAGWHFGDEMSGAAIVNLGNGKVGQRLFVQYCAVHEQLLFADCERREAILIYGVHDDRVLPVSAGHHATTIDLIQVPLGPIDVRVADSVDDVAAISDAHSYSYRRDLDSFLAGLEPQNRFDPYYGCKIYYPNSAGASQ